MKLHNVHQYVTEHCPEIEHQCVISFVGAVISGQNWTITTVVFASGLVEQVHYCLFCSTSFSSLSQHNRASVSYVYIVL